MADPVAELLKDGMPVSSASLSEQIGIPTRRRGEERTQYVKPTRVRFRTRQIWPSSVAVVLLSILVGIAAYAPPSGAGQNLSHLGLASNPPPSLSVSLQQGGFGSSVSASGSGFPASEPVTFVLSGFAVPQSSCTASGAGTFSGCTFTVPPIAPGPTVVSASNPEASLSQGPTIPVPATGPTGIAYDPYTGLIFVADGGSNAVTVVNDSTFATSTSSTGADPWGVASASEYNEVFVTDNNHGGSGDVSVLDASNGTTRWTVPVGLGPTGLAYDTNTSEVFVANTGSNSVDIISVFNASLVNASVAVGAGPEGVAVDWESGQVFVTNSLGSSVSVIDESTNAVVATIGVGAGPTGIVYDPVMNELFVANQGSSSISVISGLTDSVVATVSMSSPPSQLAYEPGTGEIIATEPSAGTVAVLSDKTNSLEQSISLGGGVAGAVYDWTTGEVFVTEESLDQLATLAPPAFATADFTVSPQISLASYPNDTFQNLSNGYAPWANGWKEDAHYVNCGWFSCQTWNKFTGDWEVPSAPTTNGALVYLFIALEPSGGGSIIQPVLQWGGGSCDGGGNYYEIASWYGSSACSSFSWSSPQRVSPGDTIQGSMSLSQSCNWIFWCTHTWTITTTDTTNGASTTLKTSSPPAGQDQAYVSLESYSVTSCSMYPSSGLTSFSSLNVQSGSPGWTNQFPYKDCPSVDNVVASGSSSVKLYY